MALRRTLGFCDQVKQLLVSRQKPFSRFQGDELYNLAKPNCQEACGFWRQRGGRYALVLRGLNLESH